MKPLLLPPMAVDAWGFAADSDRRFRWILAGVTATLFAISLLMPLLPLQQPATPPLLVRHYVELLREAKPAPPPPPPTAVMQAQRKPKPAPGVAQTPKPRQPDPQAREAVARATAERAGIADIRQQLETLRTAQSAALDSGQRLRTVSATGAASSTDAQADILHAVRRASTGVGAAGTRSAGDAQSQTVLAGHRTARIHSPADSRNRAVTADESGGGTVAARSLEEIQLAFDRSKGAFYTIFTRAARVDPSIKAGTVVISLTIAPDGTVTDCAVVSSNFRNHELQQKLLQRVKLLKFEARQVPVFTYPNYPINYLPS